LFDQLGREFFAALGLEGELSLRKRRSARGGKKLQKQKEEKKRWTRKIAAEDRERLLNAREGSTNRVEFTSGGVLTEGGHGEGTNSGTEPQTIKTWGGTGSGVGDLIVLGS